MTVQQEIESPTATAAPAAPASLRNSAGVGRRRFITTAGAVGLAAGAGPFVFSRSAHAAGRTLKILQWSHFVPAYDKWFDNTYTKEWGEKNGTEVIVDHVGIAALNSRAAAEVSAQKGHDLFMFLWPAPTYETQVIDCKDIYDECTKKHGKPIELAVRSTYNPKTKKYFGFSDSFVPDPVNYRIDLWSEQGVAKGPTSWDEVLGVGKKIKQKSGIPVGIGLSEELDTAMAMRTILFAFGGSVQDEEGKVILDSRQTREAMKFVKALYQDTMTPEVLAWDPSSNNRALLAGKVSVVLNAISTTRAAENEHLAIADQLGLTPALKGAVRAIGLAQVARQIHRAGRCDQLGDQRRLPRLCERGDRRDLQHLGAQHHVRQGGDRQHADRRGGETGGQPVQGDLLEVARQGAGLTRAPVVNTGVSAGAAGTGAVHSPAAPAASGRRVTAATVEARALTKRFDTVNAVDGIDLLVRESEFLVLLGPSGCGKTTLLRMLAGLETPTSGELLIAGEVVTHLPPRARNIAMVFQSYALYPHLSVYKNIAFPLQAGGMARDRKSVV